MSTISPEVLAAFEKISAQNEPAEVEDSSTEVADVPESEPTTTAPEDVDSTSNETPPADVQTKGSKTEDKPASDVEYLTITDESGKKKIALDWNNKDAIRKAVQMAAGARKWQAERDTWKNKASSLETAHSELEKQTKAIEAAFEKEGVKGLINLLVGKPDAYDAWFDTEFKRRAQYEGASPEQKAFFDAKAENERLQKEMAWQRKQHETEVARAAKAKEEAAKAAEAAKHEANTAMIHKEFRKHSFSGKLAAEEAKAVDNAIWHNAIEALKALPEDTELTPSVVEKAFAKEAARFSKLISVAAAKETETKKASAAAALSVDARSRTRAPTKDEAEIEKGLKEANGVHSRVKLLEKIFGGKK